MKPLVLSPSAVARYRQCARAYAFEYVEKLRPPTSPKQQFGLDVHKQLEDWLWTGLAPDDTPVGRVAAQGIQKGWLPVPDARLRLEHRFLFPVGQGVELGGYVDCVAPPGVSGPEPLVIDHKTTSDLRWSETPADLESDPQALIYSLWAMLEWSVPTVRARWIYYAASNPNLGPRKPHGAKPVEVLLDCRSPVFATALRRLLLDLGEMTKIRRGEVKGLACDPNPRSCGSYGGCYHLHRCKLSPLDALAAYLK